MQITHILEKIISGQHLTADETHRIFELMADGAMSPVHIASFLTLLRMKGESAEEIAGFVKAMRSHMVRIHASDAIDVCGTGGDGSGTFNISTAVAFVAAGAGVRVAKHGNRAASSKCGSADVLEALGIKIDLTPQQAEHVLQKTGVVFLFAPLYNPALKHVGAVRKELGIRTVFNVLGPFANPAGVKRQIIGVPNAAIAEKMAAVAAQLEYEHLLIVTGTDGLDEISLSGESTILELHHETITRKTIHPQEYGFATASVNELAGGDAEKNAAILVAILSGEKGPKRDIVIINSAAALYVSGKAASIREGITIATESIDSGRAASVVENLRKESQRYA